MESAFGAMETPKLISAIAIQPNQLGSGFSGDAFDLLKGASWLKLLPDATLGIMLARTVESALRIPPYGTRPGFFASNSLQGCLVTNLWSRSCVTAK